jgi:SAM-dependent methyltransferase
LSLHFGVAGSAGIEGLAPSTDRFGTALSDIVRCARCGHMQLAKPPPEELLEEGYTDAISTDYLSEEPGQRATARRALTMIARHVRPGALLDVGCWLGFLADEARQAGWQPIGLEPSAFASAFARERLGLDVRAEGVFEAELEPESFDAVVMADVLEHLLDPARALQRVAGLLRPGGVLLLVLPDAGSRVARTLGPRWWSVIPTHVQYFTRTSLRLLLGRMGWEVLEVQTAPKVFTLGYYIGRIGGYSPALAHGLLRVGAAAGILERPVAPDFRDRMAVLARTPARRR